MKKILLIIPLLFLACTPKVKYQLVYKTKLVYLKPPETLINYDIDLPIPPEKFTYIDAPPLKREQLLTDYIIDLLKTIERFKIKENNLKKWYKEINESR